MVARASGGDAPDASRATRVRGPVPPGADGATAVPVTPALLRAWPLPAPGAGGKEARGRVLVAGGQRELAGAVRLAGEAALRAGAGKLQVAVAASARAALAMALPEARVVALRETATGALSAPDGRLRTLAKRADARILGPGIDDPASARRLARALLPAAHSPVVLDAGAIDLALLRSWHRGDGRAPVVLTPHHGEMAALLGCEESDVAADAPAIAAAFAREWSLTLVLKAATTWIADAEGGLWIHRGGPPGLGTSGSGDVLAGLVGGLCARGARPAQAACWAVWLHARSGIRLARRRGRLGLLAREIAGEVPALLDRVEASRPGRDR